MKAKGKRTVLVMGTRVMHVSLPCLACMKQAAFKRLGADSETSDVNLLATKVGHAWWNACCARAELNKLVLFSGTFGELGDGLEVCMHILSPRQTMSDSFQVGCGPRIPYEFLARSEDKQVGTGNFQVGLSKQRPCRNFLRVRHLRALLPRKRYHLPEQDALRLQPSWPLCQVPAAQKSSNFSRTLLVYALVTAQKEGG